MPEFTRQEDKNGESNAPTLRTLRAIYGSGFALGSNDNDELSDVLATNHHDTYSSAPESK